MSDALDYMNDLCRWTDPPPSNQQWERTVAKACDIIADRDLEIRRLEKRIGFHNGSGPVCSECELARQVAADCHRDHEDHWRGD